MYNTSELRSIIYSIILLILYITWLIFINYSIVWHNSLLLINYDKNLNYIFYCIIINSGKLIIKNFSMNNNKNFFLNGEEFFSDKILTLFDVITYFNYNSALLVLEYNNFICPKENWNNIYINHKDKIEIVTIVGGG